MSASNVFTIVDTAGTPVAAIQPNTLNGPGGVQQSSDLYLYGLGFATWGQGADQNDYRLTENFACPDMTGFPSSPRYAAFQAAGTLTNNPASAVELGAGNGINVPLIGQLWYNTTQKELLVYNGISNGWSGATSAIAYGPTSPPSPINGDLWYNTIATQLEIYVGSWISVAQHYVPLSGGIMTGTLTMNGNTISNPIISGGSTNGTTLANITNSPTTAVTFPADGVSYPYVGTNPTNVIYTPANLPVAASPFIAGMIMMWHSNVAPAGWNLCDGTNGTPNLINSFVVAAGGTYGYGSTGGAAASAVSLAAAGSHSHTGFTQTYALQVADIPSHSHAFRAHIGGYNAGTSTFQTYENDASSGPTYLTTVGGSLIIQTTGSSSGPGAAAGTAGNPHNHGISVDGSHTHTGTVPTLPPYYGLFFIMKL